MLDPATGSTREVRVTRGVQDRFAAAAAQRYAERAGALSRTSAETIGLSTDGDWLTSIVRHVERRRSQAVGGGALRR
jgi:hypothetical protein